MHMEGENGGSASVTGLTDGTNGLGACAAAGPAHRPIINTKLDAHTPTLVACSS